MTAAVSPFAEPLSGTLPGASAVAAQPGIGRRVLPAPLRLEASLRVLDITEFYGPTSGGVRTYLHAKAAYVDARPDLAQVIVVPGARDTITDSAGARRYLLSGPQVPRQPQYRFLLATRSNRRIVQHERPDLIEIGSPGFVPWQVQWAARDLAIPRVAFFHSNFPRIFVPFPERAGWGGQLLSEAAWRYVRWLDRSVATTIVSSRFAAEDLARAGVDRVEQIPLGVEYAHFHPGRRGRRQAIRLAHGLDTERPLALTISRFAAEKELHVLIAGWGEVHRRTGAQLLLIGDGKERDRLVAQASTVAGVTIRPWVRDREAVAELMAAADIYIAPGPVETFGLAGLEALASGTPVLAAHRGGVAEQVEASGAGRHFAASDPEALAESAIALLRDDLGSLGTRARRYAVEHHDWSVIFDRIFALYRRVLAEG